MGYSVNQKGVYQLKTTKKLQKLLAVLLAATLLIGAMPILANEVSYSTIIEDGISDETPDEDGHATEPGNDNLLDEDCNPDNEDTKENTNEDADADEDEEAGTDAPGDVEEPVTEPDEDEALNDVSDYDTIAEITVDTTNEKLSTERKSGPNVINLDDFDTDEAVHGAWTGGFGGDGYNWSYSTHVQGGTHYFTITGDVTFEGSAYLESRNGTNAIIDITMQGNPYVEWNAHLEMFGPHMSSRTEVWLRGVGTFVVNGSIKAHRINSSSTAIYFVSGGDRINLVVNGIVEAISTTDPALDTYPPVVNVYVRAIFNQATPDNVITINPGATVSAIRNALGGIGTVSSTTAITTASHQGMESTLALHIRENATIIAEGPNAATIDLSGSSIALVHKQANIERNFNTSMSDSLVIFYEPGDYIYNERIAVEDVYHYSRGTSAGFPIAVWYISNGRPGILHTAYRFPLRNDMMTFFGFQEIAFPGITVTAQEGIKVNGGIPNHTLSEIHGLLVRLPQNPSLSTVTGSLTGVIENDAQARIRPSFSNGRMLVWDAVLTAEMGQTLIQPLTAGSRNNRGPFTITGDSIIAQHGFGDTIRTGGIFQSLNNLFTIDFIVNGNALVENTSGNYTIATNGNIFMLENSRIEGKIYAGGENSVFAILNAQGFSGEREVPGANSIIIEWDYNALQRHYELGSSTDLTTTPEYAKATWGINGTQFGIFYERNSNIGFIEVPDVVITEPVETVTLYTVNVTAANGGTATGSGEFEKGTEVAVTAEANEGYNFIGWFEDGVLASDGLVYDFTVLGHRSLEARFEVIQEIVVVEIDTANPRLVQRALNEGNDVLLTARNMGMFASDPITVPAGRTLYIVNGLTIHGDRFIVNGTLVINEGTRIDINPNGVLENNGTIINNGLLNNPSGTIINNGNIEGSGRYPIFPAANNR